MKIRQTLINGFLLILLFCLVPSGKIFSSTEGFSGAVGTAPEKTGSTDFYLYKCPFFPDGYALPKDVMIKFFALRSHYTFGKVKKLAFTIHTNRDVPNVTYKLYSGIPKNPLAVALEVDPTATVQGYLKNNARVVFDSLDTHVFPGYSQAFLLKVDTEKFAKGDWVKVSVEVCEEKSGQKDIVCEKEAVSREISFLY